MKAIWTINPLGIATAAFAGCGIVFTLLFAYPLAAQNAVAPQSYKLRSPSPQTAGSKASAASQMLIARRPEAIQPVTGRVQQGKMQRSYTLYVPTTYVKQRSYPLVIVLHGGGGNAEISETMTRFAPWAASKEFILAHPNGSGTKNALLTWNAGNCCAYAFEEKIDDVGFIRSMIDGIAAQYHIDPKRIYVAGMSNGAKMAYRLACRLSDRIAAIAPVAGSMEEPDCTPDEPVSVIAFHGIDDEHVLYEGGAPKKSVDRVSRIDNSVPDSVGFWANANQCDPLPERTQTGSVRREKYNGCLNDSEVVLYSIEGGGHAWPGGVKVRLLGDNPSTEIGATKKIVNFFLSHPKK